MAHQDVAVLQRMSHSLARRIRQQPGTTDEMYELLTLFHARLKRLEEHTHIATGTHTAPPSSPPSEPPSPKTPTEPRP